MQNCYFRQLLHHRKKGLQSTALLGILRGGYTAHFFKGTGENRIVVKAATSSHFGNADFGTFFEQLTSALHTYLHDVMGRRFACKRIDFTMQLSTTHAHSRGQQVNIEVLTVHEQIYVVDNFTNKMDIFIRQSFAFFGVFIKRLRVFEPEHTALFEQFFHPYLQLITIKGLAQIGICAGFQAFDAVGFGNFGGNNDDRNVTNQLVGTYLPTHFQSVDFGHHEVGNNEIGNYFFSFFKSFLAI